MFKELKDMFISMLYSVEFEIRFPEEKYLIRNKRVTGSSTKSLQLADLNVVDRACDTMEDYWSIDECACWPRKQSLTRWHSKDNQVVIFPDMTEALRLTALCAFSRQGRYLIQFI